MPVTIILYSYTEHGFVSHNHYFSWLHRACPCFPRLLFYMEHALDSPNNYFIWSMPFIPLPLFDTATQCPSLIPTTIILHGYTGHALVFPNYYLHGYTGHALVSHNHYFTWLHRACPCFPRLLFYMEHALDFPNNYFIWSMPFIPQPLFDTATQCLPLIPSTFILNRARP